MAVEIRSSFAMTEPAVASSDATNIGSSIIRDGDDYIINGRKWYTTGATDPRCEIIIFMGKTDPEGADRHRQQSMILVPKSAPGVDVVRSEEHTSEIQSLMRNSYAVFCLKNKKNNKLITTSN